MSNNVYSANQRRASADEDFYRGWADYKYGFGSLHGNFWLGLEKVHQMTYKRRYELRIDMVFQDASYYASYKKFALFGEAENYMIRLSGYSGNAADNLSGHNRVPFTTKDRDNDLYSKNCAVEFVGAWWYGKCHASNLNGQWGNKNYAKGPTWSSLTTQYDHVTFSEMKIRPID